MRLLAEFSSAKRQRYPTIIGTAVTSPKLGSHRFVLIPAPWLKQDYITCIMPSNISLPANMSQVSVMGKRQDFQGRFEILVDDIQCVQPEFSIKPEIGFRDFQDLLLFEWNGIESPQRELLALEIVSSPPIFEQAGGLNLSLYDGTGEGTSKRILSDLRRLIPSDIVLGRPSKITVPWMERSVEIDPFSWSFKVVDADDRLSEAVRYFLLNRKLDRGYEASVALGSEKTAPDSLLDPPCAFVDQPTLLPFSAEKRRVNVDPPPEITRYIIATHMTPVSAGKTQQELINSMDLIRERLLHLARQADVPHLVARYGIFDLDFYGKPLSIARIALASARAEGKTMISANDVGKTFDEIIAKNLECIFDAWTQLFTPKGVEIATLTTLEQEIVKFMEKNETKETGVSLDAIQDNFFNTDQMKLRDAIFKLKDLGKIYEERLGRFRTVPLE